MFKGNVVEYVIKIIYYPKRIYFDRFKIEGDLIIWESLFSVL